MKEAVSRLDGKCKAGIGFRIFMAAINIGDGRKRAELIDGIPHLFHAAFVDAAAAHGKYRIAYKK